MIEMAKQVLQSCNVPLMSTTQLCIVDWRNVTVTGDGHPL